MRYQNIRYLRVLACLGVFVTHLAPRMGITGTAARIANFGASGVYLFFLLSGFLACGSPDIGAGKTRNQKEISCGRGILIYYCKRLFRVLPLYYAVILYNMLLHEGLLQDVPADPAGLGWLRYFFLTNAVIPAPDNFWSNLCATWTISLFVAFYLLAPLLVRLARGVAGAAGLYLATLILRICWVESGLSAYMMIFYYYLHFFVLGILVRRLSERYRPMLAAGILAVAAVVLWLLFKVTGLENDYFTCLSWIFSVVVLVTGPAGNGEKVSGSVQKKGGSVRLRGLLEQAVGVLDQYSYTIYLVHAVVIDGILLLQGHVQLPAAAVFGIAVTLTAAGAYAAHHLVELPAEKCSARLVAALRI